MEREAARLNHKQGEKQYKQASMPKSKKIKKEERISGQMCDTQLNSFKYVFSCVSANKGSTDSLITAKNPRCSLSDN